MLFRIHSRFSPFQIQVSGWYLDPTIPLLEVKNRLLETVSLLGYLPRRIRSIVLQTNDVVDSEDEKLLQIPCTRSPKGHPIHMDRE